jgi:hypothetical protein
MTIPASGPLRGVMLSSEYGGSGVRRISAYYRGAASGYVRATAAGNSGVNLSAAVPVSGAMKLSKFYGQEAGWSYTNTTVRTNNFDIGSVFGTDWNVAWPKTFINNAAMGATSTAYYACIINGGVGGFSFVNNAEIQGAGGAANSGAGQHAMLIQNTTAGVNQPIITNNTAIRGGGGGGGKGGNGGSGSGGQISHYEPGPTNNVYAYARDSTTWRYGSNGYWAIIWGGSVLYNSTTAPVQGIAIGSVGESGLYYSRNQLRENYVSGVTYSGYEIMRYWTTNYTTGMGAGGAGGNGGVGQGYGVAATAGAAGAAGSIGAQYTGDGGAGGPGGAGGAWGTVGTKGTNGLNGGTPDDAISATPPPGQVGLGVNGGAKGCAINATSPWSIAWAGTLSGSYTGTAPS